MAKKQRESLRVFKSDLLERFTHVHPITPLVLWGPVACWLFWRTFAVHHLNPISVGAVAFAGLISWTLTEYLLHRFVFHFKPSGKNQEFIQFMIHGLHHDEPDCPTRLVMPPIASLILAVPIYSLQRALLGEVWVEPFFASFIVGYLIYDYTHYAVHHFTPRTRLGKYIKSHHMIHHFVEHDSRWGVSSPLWDYVFGTVHEQKKQRTV